MIFGYKKETYFDVWHIKRKTYLISYFSPFHSVESSQGSPYIQCWYPLPTHPAPVGVFSPLFPDSTEGRRRWSGRQQDSTNFMFMKINFPSLRWNMDAMWTGKEKTIARLFTSMTAMCVSSRKGKEFSPRRSHHQHNNFKEFCHCHFPAPLDGKYTRVDLEKWLYVSFFCECAPCRRADSGWLSWDEHCFSGYLM